MRIFGLGMPELVVILVVILLIFGPKNLPKLGSAFGKTIKGLRKGLDEAKDAADLDKKKKDEKENKDETTENKEPTEETAKDSDESKDEDNKE